MKPFSKAVILSACIAFLLFFYSSPLPAQLHLEYSTYLGGNDEDVGNGIGTGSDGKAYVTGHTYSTDFPTANPYQPGKSGYNDVLVSAFSPSGSALYYSTFLGGSSDDVGNGISVDSEGQVFVTGFTLSYDFPTVRPYQATFASGYADAFVSALSSSGSALVYSTYLGGNASDAGWGIRVGSDGRAYIAGSTSSTNFPTENPYQPVGNGVFVSALSSSGSALYYSTCLGGSNSSGRGISLGTDGMVYVTGYTSSHSFPTENPYQATIGGGGKDAFVFALSSSGSSLIYSTYLGGSDEERGSGIDVGTGGRAYVTGYTLSPDFPTENPYQAGRSGSIDVFMSAFSSSGSTLLYSTYLGGSFVDLGQGISLGIDQNACVTGRTSSADFPTVNPYQAVYGGGNYDVFVSSFSSSGSALIYSTYIGGDAEDEGTGVSLCRNERAYITGWTNSTDFPTANPYQAVYGGGNYDVFVCRLLLAKAPIIASGDYDGDGTSEIAIFRDSTGLWAIRGVTRVYYGSSYDIPVSGDYDGDSTAEIGIFRGSSGLWGIREVTRLYHGSTFDIPVPGDYDGNGSCDVGIFRASSGLWAIAGFTRAYFGNSGDTSVPGDYGGDGSRDIAIFRGSSGLWAIQGVTRIYNGASSDDVVPGDYNGDGTWEVGIFRASSGMWDVRGVTRVYYGASTDQPVPADYNGDLSDDIGFFRGSSGLWGIRNITRVYFGGMGDIPVTR